MKIHQRGGWWFRERSRIFQKRALGGRRRGAVDAFPGLPLFFLTAGATGEIRANSLTAGAWILTTGDRVVDKTVWPTFLIPGEGIFVRPKIWTRRVAQLLAFPQRRFFPPRRRLLLSPKNASRILENLSRASLFTSSAFSCGVIAKPILFSFASPSRELARNSSHPRTKTSGRQFLNS